jgi:predicted permease
MFGLGLGLRGDVVSALRVLSRHAGHATVVVLTLGLGLGANTAVWSVVDAVLLRPLPVADPSALVLFQWTSGPQPAVGYLTGEWWQEPSTGRVTASSFSYPAFEAFSGRSTTLAATFAWAELRRASLSVGGEAELAVGQLVSGGYYPGLGVSAILGRTITPEDDRAGAEIVAVISHGYWQRRFGGAPDVIGRSGTLEGRPFTIVGVSPRGFSGTLPLGRSADVSVPLVAWRAPEEPFLSNPTWHWLQVMGRRQPGATAAQAEAEMAPRLARATTGRAGDEPRLRLSDGSQGLMKRRHEQRRPLALLATLAGLVQLMACATVAGLLLARGAARRREIGVRLALGAARRRIVRQLCTESTLLAAAGAVLGAAVAFWTKDALSASLLRDGAPEVAIDGHALAFLGAASVGTAILSGLAPALRSTRGDLTRDLGQGERAGVGPGPGRALVIAQMAVSLVLLVGAGLFLRTLRNLSAVETGIAAEGVQLFKVHAIASGRAESLDLSRRLLERFQALPGIRAASVSAHQPVGDTTDRTRVVIEGRDSAGADEFAHVNRVGGDFFGALGIPVRAGRAIDPRDDAGARPAMVINETFRRVYFPKQDPLGRFVNGAEVVGVVGDTRYGALRDPPPPTLFLPAFQQAQGSFCFQLRTGSSLGAVAPLLRQAVREVAPAAALHDITTVTEQVEDSVSQERLLAGLASFFGAVTLSLASLGLYGLMAHAMRRRTLEIGVRMALGAAPADVLRMALGGGLRLVLAGAALGVAGALALTRLASGVLYGVTASDPLTIAAAVLLLAGVALLACWWPARRAARVDPAVALRYG